MVTLAIVPQDVVVHGQYLTMYKRQLLKYGVLVVTAMDHVLTTDVSIIKVPKAADMQSKLCQFVKDGHIQLVLPEFTDAITLNV